MASEQDSIINDMYNVSDNEAQRQQALQEQAAKGKKMICLLL